MVLIGWGLSFDVRCWLPSSVFVGGVMNWLTTHPIEVVLG
jgi:hypothetical protein